MFCDSLLSSKAILPSYVFLLLSSQDIMIEIVKCARVESQKTKKFEVSVVSRLFSRRLLLMLMALLLVVPLGWQLRFSTGMPTVERRLNNKTVSYIETTLDSLTSQLNQSDMDQILIIVLLADEQRPPREKIRAMLSNRYRKLIDRNFLHLIEAPSNYYPPLTGLPRNFGDTPKRVHWRSKQAMDFVFLMQYCSGLAENFLVLEDDLKTDGNFLSAIKNCLNLHKGLDWVHLRFSIWMSFGKFYRESALTNLARYLRMLYFESPWDLLVDKYHKRLRPDDMAYYCGQVFKHIGNHSSSRNTES
ncbi:alpha-1,3-mannosyl-glycoprotein 4-beta-N-acetylglucosaminyltransferase C isoform X7 [Nematostella vectensis]|uniref:alpha-1,3-mannosyl-glycoprotein 4-beta-N-acetylglucosaminyltransferase C isoform X7 n=1 Tax=Nematostella vectensis TaxID=45351 RepID=UPI002077410E|nr:alpha-1,3-mannosyl-glycoprotein 4-beta-N-acetylglucosaminyltransferase C isoform X7 [Nematostella vectensis]